MSIQKQKIILYIVGLLSVLFSMSLISLTIYIDVISLIVVVIAFVAGHYIYTSKKLSTYMFGVGIFVFILGLVAILLSMNDPELVYPSIAVALVSFLYFAIVAIYISNIDEIFLMDTKEIVLEKRTKGFWIAQLALVLSIFMNVGIGGYIDFTSLALFISITSVLVSEADPSVIGPNLALVLLSSFYSLYSYFMFLRPRLDEVNLIDSTNEKLYLAFVFFINFSFVLWLVSHALKQA